jgi:hypothetical protein
MGQKKKRITPSPPPERVIVSSITWRRCSRSDTSVCRVAAVTRGTAGGSRMRRELAVSASVPPPTPLGDSSFVVCLFFKWAYTFLSLSTCFKRTTDFSSSKKKLLPVAAQKTKETSKKKMLSDGVCVDAPLCIDTRTARTLNLTSLTCPTQKATSLPNFLFLLRFHLKEPLFYAVNFKHRVASCMTWHSIEQKRATRHRAQR